MKKYINMPNESIPQDIQSQISTIGGITSTSFEDKNSILTDNTLWYECGYSKIEDYFLVSMYTPMPDVTKEMIAWWFWWHPQASERYKAWFPSEHTKASYAKKDKQYFSSPTPPPFQNNTQYPVERVGTLLAPLSIDFVDPVEFGFDKQLVDSSTEIIVCGHVGAFRGLIPNTEMAHIFFKSDNGLLLVSRFWLGKNVKSTFLKKALLTQNQALGMAEHCCIEYRNLAQRLPDMYNRWQKGEI